MSENGSATATKRAMIEELKVMHRIESMLRPLSPTQQARVLNWAVSFASEISGGAVASDFERRAAALWSGKAE